MVAERGLRSQPEAYPETDAGHGAQSHLPAPQDQQAGGRAQDPPVSAPWRGDNAAESGMGGGHHLCPDGAGVSVPGGHHGLVLPRKDVLSWRLSNTLDADLCVEALKEALGKGRQGAQFTSGNSPATGQSGSEDQHGWQRQLQRQSVHRALMADGEI